MATKQTSGKARGKGVLARKPLLVCSGGKVTAKAGQSRYEAQQEAGKAPEKSTKET